MIKIKYIQGEVVIGIVGIIGLTALALIKNVNGVALSIAIGSIASIITALITKKSNKNKK